jgi:hypothetical protein
MMTIIHESGWGAWASLIFTFLGIAAVLTVGRSRRRPGTIAAAFAVAVLASGALGVGSGQRRVDPFVQQLPKDDLATKVEILSIGTREASANLLLSGGCAMLLMMIGGALALAYTRKDGPKG